MSAEAVRVADERYAALYYTQRALSDEYMAADPVDQPGLYLKYMEGSAELKAARRELCLALADDLTECGGVNV